MEYNISDDKKGILVVGDTILDTYCFGSVSRISPEAPVPVMLKKNVKNTLGGAANVAVNLIAAGKEVWLMSVVGKDENAEMILKLVEETGIHQELMILSDNRETTRKTRHLTSSGLQLLRVDEEITDDISDDLVQSFIEKVEEYIDRFSVIIISDYLKGMITESLSKAVINIGKSRNIPVLIDIKDRNINKYKNAFLLKPNRIELKDITQMKSETSEQVEAAGRELLRITSCRYVLVTLGGDGMMLISEDGMEQFPSIPVEVYDVTGAGDTAMAYLASSLGSGMDIRDSVIVSNYAASIQVSKIGTSTVRHEEVERFRRNGKFTEGKSISKDDLTEIRKTHNSIVFTNGCFDILHIGHIRYLKEVSKLGDTLVIGVNNDESVRRLKGEGRPVNSVFDRVEMLAAYPFIDYIVVFEEDTPIELIKKLKPDVLAKGADYKRIEDVVGWDVVVKNGGKVVLADYVEGKSTSKIVSKIKEV